MPTPEGPVRPPMLHYGNPKAKREVARRMRKLKRQHLIHRIGTVLSGVLVAVIFILYMLLRFKAFSFIRR